ncbi:PAS domain S-box protein [Microcoleus sp. F10-C6]|uniref:PAS domain S-box protein n=1 Tax=unclassified Microcoleus TaxID=2642155 RepID=UPI002FD4AD67
MKIIYRLILGYLTAAIFSGEGCINAKKMVATVGEGDGNRAVETILVAPQKLSYLRSASRPPAPASTNLFLDKLSHLESVNLPSENFIQSEEVTGKERTFRLKIIGAYLAFISVVISLSIGTNTVNILSQAIALIKAKSETGNDKLPEAETVLHPKEEDIWNTIANMTQDLQQTAEYALDICEEMNVSIIATTPGGHILSLNQATCQLLGYSQKELLGKPVAELFQITESPEPGLELANLTAESSVRSVEKVYLSKQGKKIIVQLSISTIRDSKGEVSGKLYVSQDITYSKRAERNLRRSEKKFRQLIETVNAAALIYHRRQLRYVNSHTEAVTGYTREELLGLDLYDLIHPDFRETVKKWGKSSQPRSSAGSRYEVRILTKTGETRWIEATVHLIKFERKGSILVTAFDISDRKLAELELETSLSLLQATIESTADGILAVDGGGKVLSFNRKFAEMWQLPDFLLDSRDNNQFLGFGINQLKYPEIFINRAKELSDSPAAESVDLIEFKDGRILERYSIPQRTGGKITGRVFSFRDVTERLQSEEKLRKSEERFHLLTRATNDAVWDFDLLKNEYWLSQEFEKLFGYKLNETQTIELESWWLNIHPEERERVKSSFNETMNSHAQCWSEEYSFRHADGGYVFVLDRGHIIRNASGKAVRALGTMMDITQRKQAEEIIRYQAVYDQLTGLPNRILFNERLLVSLKQAKKTKKMLAVMFLDLDRFKKINDTLGHAAGDRLLEGFAGRITDTLRSTDTVARWGGDEFTVLLPEINCLEDAVKTAQRILDNLKPAFQLEGQPFHVSSSIGIALYPNDGEDAGALVKNADAALYRAKEMGRNNYQLYTSTINPRSSQLLTVENRLHEDIEQGKFDFFHQPKVNITTWKSPGMEALLRSHSPELGLVAPATFIPIPEEKGLIVPISQGVLETACTQNQAWQDAWQPDLGIAANFPARQFQQFNLYQIGVSYPLYQGRKKLPAISLFFPQHDCQLPPIVARIHSAAQ